MIRLTFILIVCTVYNVQAGSIRKLTIGSPRGYTSFNMTVVHKLGLRGARFVDQIRINGEAYGLQGGTYKGSIDFEEDEYINSVHFRSGHHVDYVKFCTNKNHCLEAGGNGGYFNDKIENVRVLAIGGRSGWYVDQLVILYIPNYQPSQSESKNVGFILAYSPPFSEVEEYKGQTERLTESHVKTIEYMTRMHFDSSIEGEYMVKIGSQLGFEMKYTNLQEYKKELEKQLEHKVTKKQTIPEGYVGVQLMNGELLKGGSGTFWIMPTSAPTFSVIKLNEVKNLLGYYDLTGGLFTQMPDLKQYKTIQNGHVYYKDSARK